MNLKRVVGGMVLVVVLVGVAGMLSGCFGIPKGTLKVMKTASLAIEAEGAGLVKADSRTVTFRIKCAMCGYEADEITIPTPKPGKPYVLKWTCPECGHNQTVTIEAAPAK